MAPRARVILDNDYGSDPDGLFQLAHHLLSPSVETRLVISSKIPDVFADHDPGVVERGVQSVTRVADFVGRTEQAVPGGGRGLEQGLTPPLTRAAEAIIDEALRDDTALPLFYCAGGGLTDLATAYLHEPRIASRLTLVWIGGPDYDAELNGHHGSMEFNLSIDPIAAAVVFESPIAIWQVPQTTYEQCLMSWTELEETVAPISPLASYLVASLREFADQLADMLDRNFGETVVMGDSPLVLLTALTGPSRAEASSSTSHLRRRREILPNGTYGAEQEGEPVRVFTMVDTRLMLADMIAKLRRAAIV